MAVSNNFRDLLYPHDAPRLTSCRGLDPYTFGQAILLSPPAPVLIAGTGPRGWEALGNAPFKGVTCEGQIVPGLFPLADESAPIESMRRAAEALLSVLSEGERGKLLYPIDAPQWRRWSNPEFLINPNGVRLEELSAKAREAVLALLRASLSPVGYEKARGCMRTNAFLGELCDMRLLMNEWSYNFLLFGTPSESEPWGWSIYGHHLALNCFVQRKQMVISPTFMGAEPNIIDEGPHAGLTLFDDEENIGLALMRSLSAPMAERATIYKQMHDPAMSESRWNPADERHLGGAFRDNQVVPYEGVRVAEFNSRQRDTLMRLVASYVGYLPQGPLSSRLRAIEERLDETWWSWIGSTGDEDPFYYRIQSPVVMIEFDHHSGVWLSNQEPAKCHVHTVVRTPNGNDYGRDLLRQHYAEVHPGCSPGRD